MQKSLRATAGCAYFLVCALLCLFVRRGAGLLIGWGTLLPTAVFCPYFTGGSLLSVFSPGFWAGGFSVLQVILSGLWCALAAMGWITVQQIRRRKRN